MNRGSYYFETDEQKVQLFLNEFKSKADITASKLQEYFSSTPKYNKDNKIIGVNPPKYYTSDEFLLKKDILVNCKNDTETTFGLYIFNLFCLATPFGDIIPYFNKPFNPKNSDKVINDINSALISNKITGEQFAQYQDNFLFLSYKSTLYTPGMSLNMFKVNKKVKALKEKLLKENPDIIKNNDYIAYNNKIEKPLLELAKEELKNDPSCVWYERGGKPKFTNVYKNNAIGIGAIHDPVTDSFKIEPNSFMEGIPREKLNVFANMLIGAAYSRAVATQDGGAKTKYIYAAMQSVILADKGTDCKSHKYEKKIITVSNVKANLGRYIVNRDDKTLEQLTFENMNKYIGKEVEMRSVLYCFHEKNYCNICAGEYLYDIGLKNAGNTSSNMSSRMMNMALKQMHSSTLVLVKLEPFKYITKI
jgi:hypothetical protein